MMTSKCSAKGMLAKLATLSCWMRRGPSAYPHARGVGVLVLMCAGLIACSYRSLDKAALQAKTSVSEVPAIAASVPGGSPSGATSGTLDMRQATAVRLTKGLQHHTAPDEPAARGPSGGGMQKHVAPSFDEVAGDAFFTLLPSPMLDSMPTYETHPPVIHHAPAPALPAGHAMHSAEALAFRFHWGLLLGMVALIAIGGLALVLVLDKRRHRRQDVANGREPALLAEQLQVDDGAPGPKHNEVDARPPLLSTNGASPTIPEPDIAPSAGRSGLAESLHADVGPILSSQLEWRYKPGTFDAPEQWAMDSPVDFLPASLCVTAPAVTAGTPSEPIGPDPSIGLAEPVASLEPVGLIAPVELDASAAGETVLPPQADLAPVPVQVSADDALSRLFGQLEHSAMRESGDAPWLLIERDSELPQIMRTTSEPLPQSLLLAWEGRLRHAMADAHSLTVPSLLIGTLLLRADESSPQEAETLYAEAEEWVDLSKTSDPERRAMWEARRLDIDLRRARRKKGAERLLWLRAMQAYYAPQLAQGEPLTLFGWIDVLMFWAQCQFGNAALARYGDAETICMRLNELSACADTAQRRRIELLRQRATIEQGGTRLHTLDAAQALADSLYERVPSADNALAVAMTALARGNALPPAQAKEAYSHALVSAFMAEGEPRLREQALQCRLAVQWGYENLPGMGAHSDVALKLAERLESLRVKDPDTLQRMAQAYLRSADFARACGFCEQVWRSGHATPALLSTWKEACRQWAGMSTLPEQLAARQKTMRQLSIASAMR